MRVMYIDPASNNVVWPAEILQKISMVVIGTAGKAVCLIACLPCKLPSAYTGYNLTKVESGTLPAAGMEKSNDGAVGKNTTTVG